MGEGGSRDFRCWHPLAVTRTRQQAVIKDETGRACGVKKEKGSHPEKGRTWEVKGKPAGENNCTTWWAMLRNGWPIGSVHRLSNAEQTALERIPSVPVRGRKVFWISIEDGEGRFLVLVLRACHRLAQATACAEQ